MVQLGRSFERDRARIIGTETEMRALLKEKDALESSPSSPCSSIPPRSTPPRSRNPLSSPTPPRPQRKQTDIQYTCITYIND